MPYAIPLCNFKYIFNDSIGGIFFYNSIGHISIFKNTKLLKKEDDCLSKNSTLSIIKQNNYVYKSFDKNVQKVICINKCQENRFFTKSHKDLNKKMNNFFIDIDDRLFSFICEKNLGGVINLLSKINLNYMMFKNKYRLSYDRHIKLVNNILHNLAISKSSYEYISNKYKEIHKYREELYFSRINNNFLLNLHNNIFLSLIKNEYIDRFNYILLLGRLDYFVLSKDLLRNNKLLYRFKLINQYLYKFDNSLLFDRFRLNNQYLDKVITNITLSLKYIKYINKIIKNNLYIRVLHDNILDKYIYKISLNNDICKYVYKFKYDFYSKFPYNKVLNRYFYKIGISGITNLNRIILKNNILPMKRNIDNTVGNFEYVSSFLSKTYYNISSSIAVYKFLSNIYRLFNKNLDKNIFLNISTRNINTIESISYLTKTYYLFNKYDYNVPLITYVKNIICNKFTIYNILNTETSIKYYKNIFDLSIVNRNIYCMDETFYYMNRINNKMQKFSYNNVLYKQKYLLDYNINNKFNEVIKRWWVLSATYPRDNIILPDDYNYNLNPLPVNNPSLSYGHIIYKDNHPISFMPYLENSKGIDFNYGQEDIAVSIEIIVDMINIIGMIFHHEASQFVNCSGQEAIEFLMEILLNWLNLDTTINQMDSKGSREHYLRVYRWVRWEAEKVWFMADKDQTIDKMMGLKYIGILLENLIEYLKNHYFNIVPLWRNLLFMDIERQFNRQATNNDINIVLKKIKGKRHYILNSQNIYNKNNLFNKE